MSLPTDYQDFIALSRYARYLPEKGRRETWDETVDRYLDFFQEHVEENHNQFLGEYKKTKPELRDAILNLEVMPSMRCLMTAGEALRRDNVAGFNCSFVAVDHPKVFDEIMYVLMCGTGVGFSVERQAVSKLPLVSEDMIPVDSTIIVPDSKIGWASSFRQLVAALYAGHIPKWDVSRVRGAGEPLKTFGGRASGSRPLVDLFEFTVRLFNSAKGRQLTSQECHDLVCKVADIVVVGGVRRSALISLSNLSDQRMRVAKSGQWWEENPQRALANNSVCYTEKPDVGIFLKEWTALYESKSGERGIFNRQAAQKWADKFGRRDSSFDFGTNPCSEIILRSKQFCNLSEVVVRSDDTVDSLRRKARLATILGTLQSSLTNFRYLSAAWTHNTKEECLLGVSLTGIMDSELTNGVLPHEETSVLLEGLRDLTVEVNKDYAEQMGIPQSTSITCVKPSGTVSQLVDSASGIHPRYSDYYIRTVRADQKDPLAVWMKELGFPCEPDVMKPDSTYIFSFPMKAPDGAVGRDARTALEQLELWKLYQLHWCEHKPSVTIYVKEEEVFEVGAWVWENFDIVSGVSFLPHTDHSYAQAPYQEITKDEYEEWLDKMPTDVKWENFNEERDNTIAMQTLACTGGACDL